MVRMHFRIFDGFLGDFWKFFAFLILTVNGVSAREIDHFDGWSLLLSLYSLPLAPDPHLPSNKRQYLPLAKNFHENSVKHRHSQRHTATTVADYAWISSVTRIIHNSLDCLLLWICLLASLTCVHRAATMPRAFPISHTEASARCGKIQFSHHSSGFTLRAVAVLLPRCNELFWKFISLPSAVDLNRSEIAFTERFLSLCFRFRVRVVDELKFFFEEVNRIDGLDCINRPSASLCWVESMVWKWK